MELTEDQKFMICKSVGVRTEVVQWEDFSLHERTVSPCAVNYDGNEFVVIVGPKLKE